MQSQQLLTESEIFKDEVLSGTESTDRPSQEMSERSDYGRNHGQNLIETRCINPVSKSFILHLHEVLTRDRAILDTPRSAATIDGETNRTLFRLLDVQDGV
jgi:Fic family protein